MRASSRVEPVAGRSSPEPVLREAWTLFWRILMAGLARRRQKLSERAPTPMQGRAMVVLSAEDPMPMSALAERMQRDNSNVTGIADRLEALELVERRPTPRDRRVKTPALTDRGRALQRRVAAEVGRPPTRLEVLDRDEAQMLRDVLAKAVDAHPGA